MEHIFNVSHNSDIAAARQAARELAVAQGFDEKTSEEVALAASELASNLVKHAKGGVLRVVALAETDRAGVELEATDEGPGITDVEEALTDGFSTVGSLGTGLGAVNRLMDQFDIRSQRGQGGGTRVVARKWLPLDPKDRGPSLLDIEVATRPRLGSEVNGDTFVIRKWDRSVLLGVIDGLGHGQFAHRAAQTARQFVETHYDRPLDEIFRGAGRACRATRGCVMALARFDWAARGMGARECGSVGDKKHSPPHTPILPYSHTPILPHVTLTFASVGNIESRVRTTNNGAKSMNFIVRRGIVGVNAPNAVVTEREWDPGNVLVLFSDGLRTHWSWDDFPGLVNDSAQTMAPRLLRALAKEDDDATVVVVKGRTQ